MTEEEREMDFQLAELRDEKRRIAAEREESKGEAAERGRQVGQLQTRLEQLQVALERVRETSKAGLIEQVAELQQKVSELGARRTLNQRRASDANLADRRAAAAEERAAEAQARLGEFAIEDEELLQRAARNDELEKQARAAAPRPCPPPSLTCLTCLWPCRLRQALQAPPACRGSEALRPYRRPALSAGHPALRCCWRQ